MNIIGKNICFLSFCLVLIMCSCQVTAQSGRSKTGLNKKQQKLYEKIRGLNNMGAYQEAVKGLDQLLEEVPDFADGYHLRGSIYYDERDFAAAETDLEKVLALDDAFDPIVIYQLALAEKRQAKYGEASNHLQQFIDKGYKKEGMVDRAKKHLEDSRFAEKAMRNVVPFAPQNMGAPINSSQAEYLPVLSADGSSMIFTRRVGRQEDFFVATKKDNKWQDVQPIASLNSPFNEGAQSLSADGRLMVFTFCQSGPDSGGCDLFFSEQCGGTWSAPQRIEGPVNTPAWEAQPSLSADGSLLLFASDRPGGLGRRDIWASRRQKNGKWGKPVNLGAAINTAGNDQCPFLHADGRTFYLCSDGRPGMGGNDLYFVRLQEDGQWGSVQNLGYPINTPDDEGTLTVDLKGETAFFAKSPEGKEADLDIFSFPLYPAARPLPVTYVQGKVFDSNTGKGINARAELVDLASKQPIAIVPTCEDGSYLVCLPAGKEYALIVNKEGYLIFSEHFAPTKADLDNAFELDAPLQPISIAASANSVAAEPVTLKNVFFATGSAELLPASTVELDRLWKLLHKQADLRIQINGHTDNVGSEEDNRTLSEARAKSVYSYLLDKGISEERLRFKGFGETQPIADNKHEEGRQQNRRTEFVVW